MIFARVYSKAGAESCAKPAVNVESDTPAVGLFALAKTPMVRDDGIVDRGRDRALEYRVPQEAKVCP